MRALLNVRTNRMASQGALDDLKPEMLGSQRPGQAGVPLHAQLEGTLRRLIESGRIRPGAMIPGELELAAELGLSRTPFGTRSACCPAKGCYVASVGGE